MIAEIRQKLPQIKILCQKYRLAKLWLFGSALEPDRFTDESDIDFLYSFDDGGKYNEKMHYAALWSDMLDELRKLFKRDVQLIAYGPFRNPYFRESVEATKQLIYDKDAEKLSV